MAVEHDAMGRTERILMVGWGLESIISDTQIYYLEDRGHYVARIALTEEDILSFIDSDEHFSVVVIRNRLSDEDYGRRAASLIKEKRPSVKIISISSSKKLTEWGDINLGISAKDKDIAQAIERLP